MGVSSSVDGVPAFSRRATANATEQTGFNGDGARHRSGSARHAATSGRSTNRTLNTGRQGLYGDGARVRNGARSIGGGQGAAPRALLNGLVASAKQEHPRGEGSEVS